MAFKLPACCSTSKFSTIASDMRAHHVAQNPRSVYPDIYLEAQF
jgi:hypothetical protein